MPSKKNGTSINYQVFPTPLGEMIAASRNNRLCRLEFRDKRRPEIILRTLTGRGRAGIEKKSTDVLRNTKRQLKLYFDGRLSKFDLPTDPGGTDFQRNVWKQLTRIPSGKTSHYGLIAEKVGKPKGARAAGMAVGANPISIVVPCHRVIGKSGAMTGFGGGIWRKKWLLKHEGALS